MNMQLELHEREWIMKHAFSKSLPGTKRAPTAAEVCDIPHYNLEALKAYEAQQLVDRLKTLEALDQREQIDDAYGEGVRGGMVVGLLIGLLLAGGMWLLVG